MPRKRWVATVRLTIADADELARARARVEALIGSDAPGVTWDDNGATLRIDVISVVLAGMASALIVGIVRWICSL